MQIIRTASLPHKVPNPIKGNELRVMTTAPHHTAPHHTTNQTITRRSTFISLSHQRASKTTKHERCTGPVPFRFSGFRIAIAICHGPWLCTTRAVGTSWTRPTPSGTRVTVTVSRVLVAFATTLSRSVQIGEDTWQRLLHAGEQLQQLGLRDACAIGRHDFSVLDLELLQFLYANK